jgi:DNA repair protein RecO (recombination protein O)
MDTERAEGIVLRVQPVTESSLIITWFTREFGKLKTLSKGARRPKSPVRGKIDLFYLDEIVFLRSRRSDLHLLHDCFLENPRSALRTSLEMLTTASYLVESVDLATEPEDANLAVFELLDKVLDTLTVKVGKALPVWFDLQLLKATGWEPQWVGGSGGDKLLRSLMGATLAGVQRVRLTETQTQGAREATGRLWDQVVGRRPRSRNWLGNFSTRS